MLQLLTLAKSHRGTSNALLAFVLAMLGTAFAFAQEGPATHSQWRRTPAGWERSELWPTVTSCEVVAPQQHGAPHPAMIAAVVAFVAIAALLIHEIRPTVYHGPDRRRSHLQPDRQRVPSGSLL